MRLIKFLGMHDYLLTNFEQHQLKFNNPSVFNDPFEGIFRWEVSTDREEFKKFYYDDFSGRPEMEEYYFNNPEAFNEKLNTTYKWMYENDAITCFSSIDNELDILMWSHYAKSANNSHDGICLVFESDDLEFTPGKSLQKPGILTTISGPQKVRYLNDYPSSDPSERQMEADKFLTTKYWPWKYEDEYRYIAPAAGLYHYYKPALKEIIFGLRLADTDKAMFKQAADRTYSGIEISEIRLTKSSFNFEKVEYANSLK